jgi:PAS domain S-box-containing protein
MLGDVPLSILIVEDDDDTRDNLREILELDGHHVDEAATAVGALDRGNWSTYTSILLDRQLPDGTAFDLMPQLKRLAPAAAVIVVTGHADLAGAIEALRHGAVDYLLKPIDPDELRARLGRSAEHQRLVVAHREAERFARSALDSLCSHIAVLDDSGTILAVNQAWRAFAAANGAVVANVVEGAKYLQICAEVTGEDAKTAQVFASGIRDVLAGRRGSFELEYPCHAPDHRRWFLGRVTPFQGDGPPRVVVAHLDITARILAEEALRRTEERFRLLVQNSSDIITALAEDGTILYASPSIERVLGHRPEDRVGKNIFVDSIVHPEDLGKKRVFIDEARRRLDVPASAEFRLRHADGTWRTIEGIGQNLLADPNVGAIVANYRDITERKQAEDRALQAERLAVIGEIIAGLAHESRNALQRGQACLEMLALQVSDRPRARDLVARLQKAQDDLALLYEDLRDYAAPILLRPRFCNLTEIWRAAWTDLEPVRVDRVAVLREVIDIPDPCGLIDPSRMRQVFRNLLENALAACPDPVEIAIQCEPGELDRQPALRICLSDNGPGLSPEQRPKAFNAFHTTKTKGTGLGLAICRRIIEAHAGRIVLADRSGQGAEFIIVLPRGNP